MMKSAGRFHSLRVGLLLLAFAVVAGSLLYLRARDVGHDLVQRLLVAETREVPAIIQEMNDRRRWGAEGLEREHTNAVPESRQRLHTSLALLPVDPTQLDYLVQQMLVAQPDQLPVIIEQLAPYRAELHDRLWTAARTDAAEENNVVDAGDKRLRAASALATHEPDAAAWSQIASDVARNVVSVNPTEIGQWKEALRPVATQLAEPLSEIFQDEEADTWQRSLATSMLADYAQDNPVLLAKLVRVADPQQFAVLLPALKQKSDAVADELEKEIESTIEPDWLDQPIEQPDLSESARDAISAAAGLVTDRFAFFISMPMRQFQDVMKSLSDAGYRPTRVNPYAVENSLNVASTVHCGAGRLAVAIGI